MNGAQHVSVSTKGVIVRDGAVLLVEYLYPDDDLHYNLPGGRVRYGEPLRESLVRKVREETGVNVRVGQLLYVVEYVPDRWDYEFGDYQKVQFNFACELTPDSPEPQMPAELDDEHQTALRWVPLDKLGEVVLLPKVTDALLAALAAPAGPDPFVDKW